MNETITFRWEISQLVRSGLFSDEQAVMRTALRSLFQTHPEIRLKMIIYAYTTGEISIGKAAQIMGVSHEEMKDIIAESGAEIHLGPSSADELKQDIAHA